MGKGPGAVHGFPDNKGPNQSCVTEPDMLPCSNRDKESGHDGRDRQQPE